MRWGSRQRERVLVAPEPWALFSQKGTRWLQGQGTCPAETFANSWERHGACGRQSSGVPPSFSSEARCSHVPQLPEQGSPVLCGIKQTLLMPSDTGMQRCERAEGPRAAAGGAVVGGRCLASRSPGTVSCETVIGSRDLLNDTVDYFPAIMSECNLVMVLRSHVYTQRCGAHGW